MSAVFPTRPDIAACIASGLHVSPGGMKLPARSHDAGAYRPGGDCPEPAAFAPLLGVPPVERVVRRGDWLYCDLTGGFYSACVAAALSALPPLEGDGGSLGLNRALRFSRKGGTGCPDDAAARRALLLALCAGEGKGALLRAESALLALYRDRPPRERLLLTNESGQLFCALGRLLSFYVRKAPLS